MILGIWLLNKPEKPQKYTLEYDSKRMEAVFDGWAFPENESYRPSLLPYGLVCDTEVKTKEYLCGEIEAEIDSSRNTCYAYKTDSVTTVLIYARGRLMGGRSDLVIRLGENRVSEMGYAGLCLCTGTRSAIKPVKSGKVVLNASDWAVGDTLKGYYELDKETYGWTSREGDSITVNSSAKGYFSVIVGICKPDKRGERCP